IILSRQRRLFARVGGRQRLYVACATGGLALGALVYLAAMTLGVGRFVMIGGALAALTFSLPAIIVRLRNAATQLRWAASGAGLMLSLSAAIFFSLSGPARRAAPGVWLTSIGGRPHGADAEILPHCGGRRSKSITDLLADIATVSSQARRWWVVSSSPGDVPAVLRDTIRATHSAADPSVSRAATTSWKPNRLAEDFLTFAQVGRDRFDVILLAPIPADHNQAWRCYNKRTLKRCAARAARGGLVLLRTQTGADKTGCALAVAETFRKTVGSGWAAFALQAGRLDMLLIGPTQNALLASQDVHRKAEASGAALIELNELHRRWGVKPLRVVRPSGLLSAGSRVDASQFQRRLHLRR
ncbi:MAG: hypothetical protein J7M14_02365, partial [Planctomycetes bacterium]|nr:hypothetical protein [Planctomycetota bacterium]